VGSFGSWPSDAPVPWASNAGHASAPSGSPARLVPGRGLWASSLRPHHPPPQPAPNPKAGACGVCAWRGGVGRNFQVPTLLLPYTWPLSNRRRAPQPPGGRRSRARPSIGAASLLGLQARGGQPETGKVQRRAGRAPRQAGQGMADLTDGRGRRLALGRLARGAPARQCGARPEPRVRWAPLCVAPARAVLALPPGRPRRVGRAGARASAGARGRRRPLPSPLPLPPSPSPPLPPPPAAAAAAAAAAAESAGSSRGLGGGTGAWPQLLLHLLAPSICRGDGPAREHKRGSAVEVGVALAFPR
jgi:hypothetical protein